MSFIHSSWLITPSLRLDINENFSSLLKLSIEKFSDLSCLTEDKTSISEGVLFHIHEEEVLNYLNRWDSLGFHKQSIISIGHTFSVQSYFYTIIHAPLMPVQLGLHKNPKDLESFWRAEHALSPQRVECSEHKNSALHPLYLALCISSFLSFVICFI